MKLCLPLFVSMLMFSLIGHSATILSNGDGDWTNPTTWTTGTVPAAGDAVTIQLGHTVTISNVVNTVGVSTTIIIEGVLLFDSFNSQLNIPCGSTISITPSGSIQTTIVGPSLQALRLCRTNVWVSGDGTLTGPIIFGIVLPIELTFFDALENERNMDFAWATASESKNDYFTIEGSHDGLSWNVMSTLDGAGTTQETQRYQLQLPNNERFTYFRLKQTDFNGQFAYSDIVSVQLSFGEFNVYPNPFNGTSINIDLPSTDEGVLQIVDATGSVSYNLVLTGSDKLQISDLNLNAGVYILRIEQKNLVSTERIVVR